jgi:siroheme synthase
VVCRLADLAQRVIDVDLRSPAIIVVGEEVSLADAEQPAGTATRVA